MPTPRRKKAPEYRKWHFQKRIKHPGARLPSSPRLFRRALGILWRNKKLFGGILLIYVILSFFLVRGFDSVTNLSATKASLNSDHVTGLNSGASLLGNLFTSSSSTSAGAGVYQSVLFLVFSLVIIWALRQVYSSNQTKDQSKAKLKSKSEAKAGIKLKAAFYQSTGPFVPFILVCVVILLQLIPLMIGMGIYAAVARNGLAVSGFEQVAWILSLSIFCIWSFYMLSSSIFALYIVTLPEVAPMQALRKAKQLVRYRRWTVMRKVLALPLILFGLTCLVMLPIVLVLTPLAQWAFFIWGLGLVVIAHAYLYNLYRELL